MTGLAASCRTSRPMRIQEFAVRTANEDADTGGTTAGSVVITTKQRHQRMARRRVFLRARCRAQCALPDRESRRPIPSSRSRGRIMWARSAGRSQRTNSWVFASFEHVHENASIAYSPASTAQFDALAQLAADGLIPGVPSIAVPQTFRSLSAITSARCVLTGRNLRSRNGSCALRRQLPHAQHSGGSRPRCLPPA